MVGLNVNFSATFSISNGDDECRVFNLLARTPTGCTSMVIACHWPLLEPISTRPSSPPSSRRSSKPPPGAAA